MRFTSITLPVLKSELNVAHVVLGSVSNAQQQTLLKQYRPAEFEAWKPTRQSSFLAGRAAVQQWQTEYSKAIFAVPRQSDGSPLWPASWLGSIAHSRTEAVAVLHYCSPQVSPRPLRGIGIDVESVQEASMLAGSADLLAHQSEQKLFEDAGYAKEEALLAIFSIKESIYKAIYPSVKRYVDFLEVKIISIDRQGYWIGQMCSGLAQELYESSRISGRLWQEQEQLYSVCALN